MEYELCPICLERETALEARYIYNLSNCNLLKILNRIYNLDSEIDVRKSKLIPVLEHLIKIEIDDKIRKKIINLKRDVFNERIKLYNNNECHLSKDLKSQIYIFFNLLNEKKQLLNQLEKEDSEHLDTERTHLFKIFSNDTGKLTEAIPFIQPLILEKFNQYLEVPLFQQTSKIRKIDYTLTKILSRASLKTSPFSTLTYTKVKSVFTGKNNMLEKRSIIKINESYLFRLFDQCIKQDYIQKDIYFSIIETLSIGEDKLFWTILVDNPEERGKVYKTQDRLITIKKNDILLKITEYFKGKKFKLEDINGYLSENLKVEKSKEFIDQLINKEFLVPLFSMEQNTDNLLNEFINKLSKYKHNSIVQEILNHMKQIEKAMSNFDSLNVKQQFTNLTFIYDSFDEICSLIGLEKMDKSKMIYQDAIYCEIEYFDSQKIDYYKPTLETIMQLFNVFNEPYIIQKLMAKDFKNNFGNSRVNMGSNWEGAIRVLLNSYLNNMNIWEKQYSIDNRDYNDQNIAKLNSAKNKFVKFLEEKVLDGNDICLDESIIKNIIAEIPKDLSNRRQSNSFFVQYEQDQLVLNHFYEGNLCYFGRFLKYFDKELSCDEGIIKYIDKYIKQYHYYDINSTYGFNANSRFEICDSYIDLMNTPQKTNNSQEKSVSWQNLDIQYNEKSEFLDLFIGNEKIQISYFGSLIPMLLPGVVSNLTMLSRQTTMYTDFNRMILSFSVRNREAAINVIKIPRVTIDKVILCKKKWVLNLEKIELPDSIFDLLYFFNKNDIPLRFFAYDFDLSMKSEVTSKPQYIDITSNILRKIFFQLIEDKQFIVLEEQKPYTDSFDKCKEYLYEISKGELQNE